MAENLGCTSVWRRIVSLIAINPSRIAALSVPPNYKGVPINCNGDPKSNSNQAGHAYLKASNTDVDGTTLIAFCISPF